MVMIFFGILAWLVLVVIVVGLCGLVAEDEAMDRKAAADRARRLREDASGARGRMSNRPALR